MTKIYSGIGPRDITPDIAVIMTNIGLHLSSMNWWLRSGNARGSDKAFQKGASNQQIFLPWEGYNHDRSNGINMAHREVDQMQLDLATMFYEQNRAENKPAWNHLKESTQALLCRNVPVILGEYLDQPSDCIITYMPEGYDGGTTHAVKIARAFDVPIFNIAIPDHQDQMMAFINNNNTKLEISHLAV